MDSYHSILCKNKFTNHALQSDSEGGSIDMCRAFEEWQEECIQKGVATGITLVK